MIEARAQGSTIARIVIGRPCRADIEGNELLVGSEPLVAQVGNHRWTGDETDHSTTLRRDGEPVARIRDLVGATPADATLEVSDASGTQLLRVSGHGEIANGRGEVLRRAEAMHSAIRIGDAMVIGTNDVALGVLITAPELIPEVRALAVCHRLFRREQTARN